MSRFAQFVALLSATLVLAGCSDSGKNPGTLATGTPTPTVSTTSPAPATEAEVVLGRVRAYVRELNHAVATGDTSRLVSYSLPNCFCRNAIKFVRDAYARGQLTGSTTTIRKLDLLSLLPHRAALVQMFSSVAAGTVVNGSGQIVKRYAAVKLGSEQLRLAYSDGQWLVQEVHRSTT